jgi:hypothetical protein
VRHRKAQAVEQPSPALEKSARYLGESEEIRQLASPGHRTARAGKFEFAKSRVTRRFGAGEGIRTLDPNLGNVRPILGTFRDLPGPNPAKS